MFNFHLENSKGYHLFTRVCFQCNVGISQLFISKTSGVILFRNYRNCLSSIQFHLKTFSIHTGCNPYDIRICFSVNIITFHRKRRNYEFTIAPLLWPLNAPSFSGRTLSSTSTHVLYVPFSSMRGKVHLRIYTCRVCGLLYCTCNMAF